MASKEFILFASTLNKEIIDRPIWPDALDTIAYSKDWAITANGEREAISKFQESDIFYQFCEEHNYVHTYIKAEGDAFFRNADLIPLTTD